MGPLAGRAGASPWSDLPVSGRAEVPPRSALPLNRVLYMPFSIFVYSSNIVIASLVRINSTLAEGIAECRLQRLVLRHCHALSSHYVVTCDVGHAFKL